MNPFVDVSVMPMYGELSAQIVWRVMAGYELGVFVIERSPDGLNNWREIGRVPGVLGSFTDTKLITRGRLDETYYRVTILLPPGKSSNTSTQFRSDVISTFGKLTRKEFGIARSIMRHEWFTLRQFTPAKFYKLRTDGPKCKRCVDEDTGQAIGISLCPVCYSTTYEDGYYPAVDTFMHIGSISSKIQDDTREGVGSRDSSNVRVRLPAYPLMEKNDMLVNPSADRRYLVETIDYGYFNGKIPVYAEASVQLLARNDIRYQFPL